MRINHISPKQRLLIAGAVVLVAFVFFMFRDIKNVSLDYLRGTTPPISKSIMCKPTVLDTSVLNTRKRPDESLRILVHMNERPSADLEQYLLDNGVKVYNSTWIFDYLVAETTVNKLCFVQDIPGVTRIGLGEEGVSL